MSSQINSLIKEKSKWDNLRQYLKTFEAPLAPSHEKWCLDQTEWVGLLSDIEDLCRSASTHYSKAIFTLKELDDKIATKVAKMREAARLGLPDATKNPQPEDCGADQL